MYQKIPLSEETRDTLRVNLSVRDYKLHEEPCCDFCGADDPTFIYGAFRTGAGELKRCWRWAACIQCSSDVDANDWKNVEKRIVDWLSRVFPHTPARWLHAAAQSAIRGFHEDAVRITHN